MKLMKFQTKVRYLKVRGILWYHEPNNSLYPGKYAHHLLILFYPFWDEKDLLSGCLPLYQNKLLEPGVQTVANSNKIKFEPFGNLVDDSYSRYNANMLDNQDPFGLTFDETGKAVYSNDQDDENTESKTNSVTPNFIWRIMADDEILENNNSLISQQCDVFNVAHNWAKE